RGCPQLHIVATSRQPLGAEGEVVWPVRPLSLAGPEPVTLEMVRQSEAGRLFVSRARARAPDFELTADNAATVGHICQRLDGLPLAVELVAARVASLDLDVIATRLDTPSVLQLGGWREAPARQQTLRATLDWTYERLSEHEQALFRRLAVFVGGFSEG